ncbi:MAG: metallophosphoesterase [Candidatus Omnitrophota bacterium]
MKIVVISDTHIPDKAGNIPQAVIKEFKTADMVIHAGDLVSLSVLKTMKELCSNVKAVAGNMDHPEVKLQLPEKEIIKVGKYKLGLMHGWGAPNQLIELLREEFKKDCVNIIVFGHSHNSVNEQRSGILFFNPGSLTDKIFAESNSYGIIDINDRIQARIVKI